MTTQLQHADLSEFKQDGEYWSHKTHPDMGITYAPEGDGWMIRGLGLPHRVPTLSAAVAEILQRVADIAVFYPAKAKEAAHEAAPADTTKPAAEPAAKPAESTGKK